MLKNYFPIIAAYKKINGYKDLRKSEVGDWFLVKKRVWLSPKSEWITTIYRGRYHSSNKKGVKFEVGGGEVHTCLGEAPIRKNLKTMAGLVQEDFKEEVRIFKWEPKFPLTNLGEPLITDKTLSLIRKYIW